MIYKVRAMNGEYYDQEIKSNEDLYLFLVIKLAGAMVHYWFDRDNGEHYLKNARKKFLAGLIRNH